MQFLLYMKDWQYSNNRKKQTNNTIFENLIIGAFIRFILYNVNLSSEACFDNMPLGRYQLTDLIYNFFRNFVKISQFFSHFGVSITNKGEDFPYCSQNLTKEKNLPIKPPGVHAQGTIMLCLYYYVFVMSFLGS